MSIYVVELLVRMKVSTNAPEEAENLTALLIRALERTGLEVTINEFEEQPKTGQMQRSA